MNSPPVGEILGLEYPDAESRGFVLKNDPKVSIFEFAPDLKLELNIQTDQYGRTFEDRSHVFKVRRSPLEREILDLSIRGKRGDAVQVYPNMFQSFVPNVLNVPPDAAVNVHWTGSKSNNAGNDGRGADNFSAKPGDPRQTDFHALASTEGDSCLESGGVSASVSTSLPSVLTGLNDSCRLRDWQHQFLDVPVDVAVNMVAAKVNRFTDSESGQSSSLRSRDLSFNLKPGNAHQVAIQPMTQDEFKFQYEQEYLALTLPDEEYSQFYFRIQPVNVDIHATIIDPRKSSVFYIWCSLKNRWIRLPISNGAVSLANTQSGLLVQSTHIDEGFSLVFSIVIFGLGTIALGSALFFKKQPDEWSRVKRGFNEFILGRPI